MRPIDADALVLELCQRNNKPFPSSFNHDFIEKGVLRDFLVCIAEAPTIDCAPVKHGEWKHFTTSGKAVYITDWLQCSVCGRMWDRPEGTKYNFCPNCGAKNLQTNRHEECRFYTSKCYSGDGCLGTREIDQCKGDSCEHWEPKEE